MPTPRKSRILNTIRAGKKAITYKINLSCPRVAEIAAMAGFDGIWICQEHVPTDMSVMESQIMAAKCHDCDCLVRVPKGCYSDYILPLECDASGIIIPHLMSLDEAKEIAHTVRFHPIGRRPVDGGNADGLYGVFDFKEYIQFCNANRMIIVQIEDPEPLSKLDEICQVEGIDMIFFGPGDFSHAIGVPGEYTHPEVNRVRKLVVDTAHKYGKMAGTVCVPSLDECFAMGYDMVNGASDVGGLDGQTASVMKHFHEIMDKA